MTATRYDTLDERTLQRWVARTVSTVAASRGLVRQHDLAATIGWTDALLSQKMTGRSKFSLHDLTVVADTLDVGVGELLNGWNGAVPIPEAGDADSFDAGPGRRRGRGTSGYTSGRTHTHRYTHRRAFTLAA